MTCGPVSRVVPAGYVPARNDCSLSAVESCPRHHGGFSRATCGRPVPRTAHPFHARRVGTPAGQASASPCHGDTGSSLLFRTEATPAGFARRMVRHRPAPRRMAFPALFARRLAKKTRRILAWRLYCGMLSRTRLQAGSPFPTPSHAREASVFPPGAALGPEPYGLPMPWLRPEPSCLRKHCAGDRLYSRQPDRLE